MIIGLSPGQSGDAPAGRESLRRLGPVPGGPALIIDRQLYRRRNEVERFFCRLKRFRRIASRYDRLDLIYDALQLL